MSNYQQRLAEADQAWKSNYRSLGGYEASESPASVRYGQSVGPAAESGFDYSSYPERAIDNRYFFPFKLQIVNDGSNTEVVPGYVYHRDKSNALTQRVIPQIESTDLLDSYLTQAVPPSLANSSGENFFILARYYDTDGSFVSAQIERRDPYQAGSLTAEGKVNVIDSFTKREALIGRTYIQGSVQFMENYLRSDFYDPRIPDFYVFAYVDDPIGAGPATVDIAGGTFFARESDSEPHKAFVQSPETGISLTSTGTFHIYYQFDWNYDGCGWNLTNVTRLLIDPGDPIPVSSVPPVGGHDISASPLTATSYKHLCALTTSVVDGVKQVEVKDFDLNTGRQTFADSIPVVLEPCPGDKDDQIDIPTNIDTVTKYGFVCIPPEYPGSGPGPTILVLPDFPAVDGDYKLTFTGGLPTGWTL